MGVNTNQSSLKDLNLGLTRMARMGSTVLVALVTIFAVADAARIRRESGDCEKSTTRHNACVKQAYDTYVAERGAGDDGRGDWEARKSCIYVNTAIGECGDVLNDCYGEDEANARKDHQVATILKQLERTVGGWDSSKCPVVSAYLERQAANNGEEVVDGDQGDGDGEEEENDDDEEADGEESDGEEGDVDKGEAEDGEGKEGDDGEGDESEDGGEEDEDTEEDDEEEDAEEEDDESSSQILISSFSMVLACLLSA